MFSTLAYENRKEKKGNPPNHYLDKQTYIARDTWMPSLENWGGGLKIFYMYMYIYETLLSSLYISICSSRYITGLYDKRVSFNFEIVNLPYTCMCSNIPAKPTYGVYVSQLIRICRIY